MPITYNTEGHIANVSIDSIDDAKSTLEEIHSKQSEFTSRKEAVESALAQTRANLRSAISSISLPVRAKGAVGQAARRMEQRAKTSIQSRGSQAIQKLESQRAENDARLAEVHSYISQVEAWIAANPVQ